MEKGEKKIAYIAGKMLGVPYYNYGAFKMVDEALRMGGYKTINPHTEDLRAFAFNVLQLPKTFNWAEMPPGMCRRAVIAKSLKGVLHADTLAVICKERQDVTDVVCESAGTAAEVSTAIWMRIPIIRAFIIGKDVFLDAPAEDNLIFQQIIRGERA